MSAAVATIRAPRIDLVSMSPEFIDALVDGRRDNAAELLGAPFPDDWPDRHDEGFLRLRLGQMRKNPDFQEWAVRALVLREPAPELIGHAGFHGPPGVNGLKRNDAVEVGYTVFPPFRGLGYASEAVVALMEWARAERGIRHFIASVSPENEASLAIVRKLGFERTGEQWDEEDGLELVFERSGP